MAIRWKKDDRETGLRAVVQIRCDSLRDTKTGQLYVWTNRPPYSLRDPGPTPWTWFARLPDGQTVQSKQRYADGDLAKAAADAWFKKNRDKMVRQP